METREYLMLKCDHNSKPRFYTHSVKLPPKKYEKAGHPKISDKIHNDILQKWRSGGFTKSEISCEVGVSLPTVWKIIAVS
jgi:hypothetical protein